MIEISTKIRNIPDFPQKGVLFRDITTLLKDSEGLKKSIEELQKFLLGLDIDIIVGAESRGFIFSVPIAYNLNKGFVPVRKKGRLPAETYSVEYSLEYGTAVLEIHKDAIMPGQKVAIVDDLLATGGTAEAMIKLVEKAGGKVVAVNFLLELEALNGRSLLKGYNVNSVLKY